MSSEESSSTEVAPAGGPLSPRGSLALALACVATLAVLVWAMAPERADFTPAPLKPVPEECPHVVRDFLPSNVTELAEPPLRGMDEPWKARAFRRLNFERCPCGCNLSVAACRVQNPHCPRSKAAAEEIIRAAREEN
jgi:hypothetical protein